MLRISRKFPVRASVNQVWAFVMDVDEVFRCLPGAVVTGRRPDGWYEASLALRFGLVFVRFAGVFEIARIGDARAVLRARGGDASGRTKAEAPITLSIESCEDASLVGLAAEIEMVGGLQRLAEAGGGPFAENLMQRFGECIVARVESMASGSDKARLP